MFAREIYSNESIKISEEKKVFTIFFNHPNQLIIDSLIKTRIIQGAVSSEDYKILKFKANKVETFNQYQQEQKKQKGSVKLTVNAAASMLYTLSSQLNYLVSIKSHTILGYAPKDILVINDNKFVFIGAESMSEIEETNTLVSCPFLETDFFVSPELLKVKELPSYVHYKTAYFSLGCLIVYALLGYNEFYTEYLKNKEVDKIMEYLNNHAIKDTKIYWLISRCLVEDPEKRSILYL
jgi:serine/threonine protein kinase